MGEPTPERYSFREQYTVAWPIWAGGYPAQEHALAIVNEHEGELSSLVAARLESSYGKQLELTLSWQAMGYRPVPGLSPDSPEPNSLELTIGARAGSSASVNALDMTGVSSAVQELFQNVAYSGIVEELAKDVARFIRRRMPGVPQGANIYDVVPNLPTASHVLTSELPEAEGGAEPGIALDAPQPVSSIMALRIRPYRYALTLGQLQQLASSPGNGGEDVIDTYYGWRNDRTATAAKGMGGAALSLLVAWLVPFLKNEYAKTPLWLVLGPPLLTIIALAAWSLVAVVRLNRIHASYVASAALLQTFR
jgi:hypothetical protein